MRNIFLFIRRYFNFLFFLVMQIIALSFLVRYNKFHEAAFMGISNELTGRIGSRYDNIQYYFHLKKTNESLVAQNESLLNQLPGNFQAPDTAVQLVSDTVLVDSVSDVRRYRWRSAKVVNNSIALQHNYITLHRGENQGVKKDMGVISAEGIVGMVVNTSENFSVVMSLLNRQSSVSAKLKKTGEIGKVMWTGETPDRVTMINIPASAKVNKGDSVVTSGYSLSFPANVMIGRVVAVKKDKLSNFLTLEIRPSTNFYSVEYVMVVDNLQKDEQKTLEEANRKNQ